MERRLVIAQHKIGQKYSSNVMKADRLYLPFDQNTTFANICFDFANQRAKQQLDQLLMTSSLPLVGYHLMFFFGGRGGFYR